MKPIEIKWKLEEVHKTQAELSRHLELDPAAVNRMLSGNRKISAVEMTMIDVFLNDAFSGQINDAPVSGPGAASVRVPEIDVRAGAGGGGLVNEDYFRDENGDTWSKDGVLAEWDLPVEYVRHALRADTSHLRIVEVLGDSNFPTLSSGDKVFVDLSHRVPSPDGLFALWDGMGVVIKRIEKIPMSDPTTLKLISDNPRHNTYEITLDEANIIGRVCGRISVL